MNKFKNTWNDMNSEKGLFRKITKKYSKNDANIVTKLTDRTRVSPHPISVGIYNMSGYDSEDHKPEIGAPILLSKRNIDNDPYMSIVKTPPIKSCTSSESENEIYADASDSLQNISEAQPNSVRLSTKNVYEKENTSRLSSLKKSKSTQNVHKSELKIYLQKTPSLVFDREWTASEIEQCCEKEMSSQLQIKENMLQNFDHFKYVNEGYMKNNKPNISQQCEYSYVTNGNLLFNKRNTGEVSISNMGIVKFENEDSLGVGSAIDDFDMKSISFQSLDPKSLFMSVEELNEITRHINESEEFAEEINFDYCKHRDNLKLSERRITLLKNKNGPMMNFEHKREKLNHAWNGIKHWIDGERDRFKGVIQKHAAMQRVGSYQSNVAESMKNSEFKADINKIYSTSKYSDKDSSHISSNVSSPNSFSKEMSYDNSEIDSVIETNKDILLLFKKTKYKDHSEGQNGFEELRRYVKQGGDFGKDLATILQERVESEQLYAKSLSKMASKLNKACREIPGSIADAWRGVATEMENRSDIHRQFSNSLVDEIVKPLKTVLDNQHKSRKSVESNVDKSTRILSEWRASEAKAKKVSHTAARENEKLQDAMLDVRIQKSPSVALLQQSLGGGNSSGIKTGADKEFKSAEKDCAKLDNKRRKAEEAVKRADVQYYTLCIRAERARFDWEMSVLRGSSLLQSLENQRLINMKNYVSAYLRLSSAMNPMINSVIERLTPQVEACNVHKDLAVIQNIRRASEGPSEQLLPDFYCEHTTLAMNRERRKHALVKLIQLVKTDLERERKSKNGLKGLCQSLNAHDNQNVTEKLYHIRSMLTYLEGTRFKLQSALLELDHKPRNSHPLAPHIQITRDRTGLQQSILKVPLWLKSDDTINDDMKETDLDLESHGNENCLDIKNETLIKSFDKNFLRSKSSSEIALTNVEDCKNEKAHTLPIKDIGNQGLDRGTADGLSSQLDSDFDEFSSQEDEDEATKKGRVDILDALTSVNNISKSRIISRCKALYSYTPKLYDELELTPGDIIEVHAKQEDGWWLGALKNQIGLFPATYVEEVV